jgi:histidyl-tRNA synthetase
MAIIKAVRGTRDLLPPETELWNRVEATARAVFARYAFGEIRTPIFESTELFARGVGEETDIVSKEMYTWEDGERFEKRSLQDAWLRKHDERFRGFSSREDLFDIEVSTSDGPAELVAFSHHPQPELVAKISAFDTPSYHSEKNLDKYIEAGASSNIEEYLDPNGLIKAIKRLVVSSPIPNKPDEWINDDFVIEHIFGNFLKSSQSLTLRPENTAGVVRAYIEHGLADTGMLQKLFYIGPQFRRERPQRGRYRQFWQIGVEVLGPAWSGSDSSLRDAEVLEMLATLLNELGIKNWRLALNSVGSSEDRKRYNVALREALTPVKDKMCADNQRRAETNPLRVLDSKEPADQDIINALPKIADFLDEESTQHFAQVKAALDACGVPYTVEPRLVRGLDYYTRTTFEFTVPDGSGLGTQNALLGGGRYDGLSEMLGGPKAPGIGFAIGEDRLILTLQAQAAEATTQKLDAFIAPMGVAQNPAALALAKELREAGLRVEVGEGSFRLRKSFETADKLAHRMVIVGEDEVNTGIFTVKYFEAGEQTKVPRSELVAVLKN